MRFNRSFSLSVAFLILAGLVGGAGLNRAAASPPAQETPDAILADSFGYTVQLVDLPWIEANGGTLIPFTNMNNSMVKNLDIGFSFPFYEGTFTQLNVSTNGFISFGVGDDSLFPTPLPWVILPNNLIAPLWHDFIPSYNELPAYLRAYIFTQGSAPARRRVIEWEAWDNTPGSPGANLILNYEVILYEDTHEILFQYVSTLTTRLSRRRRLESRMQMASTATSTCRRCRWARTLSSTDPRRDLASSSCRASRAALPSSLKRYTASAS